MYSIIIPAYNEEAWLAKSIPAAHRAMENVTLRGEIIVVDNNSTDSTSTVAENLGAEVVFEPINQISRARNTGARAANGDFYIFLDADTMLTTELLKKAVDAMLSHRCCGGGVPVALEASESKIAPKLFLFFVKLIQLQQVATGCFVFCRADAFRDIGGFSEKVYASEEYWFSLNLKRWGRKKQMPFEFFEGEQIVTSSRKFDHPQSLWAILLLAVPFAIFFRSLCRFWYKRP